MSYLGINVGAQPEAVDSWFAKRYRNCPVEHSIYHSAEGHASDLFSDYYVNRGSLTECHQDSEPGAIEDSIDVRLAHPAVDPTRAAYLVDIKRNYPDILLAPPRKVRYPFDKLRNELFRMYGKPIEERRVKVSSASADLAKSLGLGGGLKREDFLVRYLWATKGKLPDDKESTDCDCGDAYVKADIEVSRSPSTSPRNQLYVLSVSMFLENSAVRRRQEEWNAQWQRKN